MNLLLIYTLSTLLLLVLLGGKKYQLKSLIWFAKPCLSLMFILVAVMHTEVWSDFHLLMLTGFALCLLGDVFLIPTSKGMFLMGLVSFLAGHLIYISAFWQLALIELSLVVPAGVIVVVNAVVHHWLKCHIEAMKTSVLFYMAVISVMVLMAFAVMNNADLPISGRVLLLSGAILFFVSDLFVVREQFVNKSFLNPLLGLPLYYGGQFALAISLGYITWSVT